MAFGLVLAEETTRLVCELEAAQAIGREHEQDAARLAAAVQEAQAAAAHGEQEIARLAAEFAAARASGREHQQEATQLLAALQEAQAAAARGEQEPPRESRNRRPRGLRAIWKGRGGFCVTPRPKSSASRANLTARAANWRIAGPSLTAHAWRSSNVTG